jgi:hypothetical protein
MHYVFCLFDFCYLYLGMSGALGIGGMSEDGMRDGYDGVVWCMQ